MKIFHCDHCDHLVVFESTQCLQCGRLLAYLPDVQQIGSLEAVGGGLWRSPIAGASGAYRQCSNYADHGVCNWAVPASDPNALCASCRLTRVIPDLDAPENRDAWRRLEAAKRRLVYTLVSLDLPVVDKETDPVSGLAFAFLADPAAPDQPPVYTGHADGLITLNVAEADDAERERRRLQMHEPYRTLLGHFRHESGHYYWNRLVENRPPLATFRSLFGDERQDYGEALARHHDAGPAPDWQDRFVTAYAGAHPWEDWAESWAHYLHMTDTLEMAAACGLSIRPPRRDEPVLPHVPGRAGSAAASFDGLIESWFPLAYVLNNLNRGLGLPDAYPFVLSTPAIEKLRFVHDTIAGASTVKTAS